MRNNLQPRSKRVHRNLRIVHAKSVLIARHSQLQAQHEKLAEITYKCLDLSSKLKNDV